MTVLNFSFSSAPTLNTIAGVAPGQPFMISGVEDVYQATAASSGGVRQCRRMSDGFLSPLADATGVLEVSIDSADISA